MSDTIDVRVKGRTTAVPAVTVGGIIVASMAGFPKISEIFDECWLERSRLPPIEFVIAELRNKKDRPDIFTFAQRVPDAKPAYTYYHEFDNYAVLPISTYEDWFGRQILSSTRQMIRASEKRGTEVRVSVYDDNYIEGIMSIYNEIPFRRGKQFWHFGKSFEAVKAENGTYAERSTYLAAYCGDEMIGCLKIVWDADTASIMQLLSKISSRDRKPNNALLSEAVRQCCLRNVGYLLYGPFEYGNKIGDSLTRFKQSNGFSRMNVPRYYVPLTRTGALALRMGFHKKLAERVPEWIAAPLRDLRTKWYKRNAP
jgi:hypothetical protein